MCHFGVKHFKYTPAMTNMKYVRKVKNVLPYKDIYW